MRDLPEFSFLMSLDRSKWPRCLLWHGWLPGLNGVLGDKPWALSFSDLASFHLESCLGAYPVDFSDSWTPPDYWDADDIALEMPDHPNIWTLPVSIPDQGHSTPRRWKRLRPPSSKGVGGQVGEPRNLFPRLGVG